MEEFRARRKIVRCHPEPFLSPRMHSLQRSCPGTSVGAGVSSVLVQNETASGAVLSAMRITGIASREYRGSLLRMQTPGVRL